MSRQSPKKSDCVFGAAPGRVNLIGEHTDYNGGFMLPTTLPQQTRATVTLRGNGHVSATSADLGDQASGEYALGSETPTHTWLDYVQGLTWALRERNVVLPGFSLSVTSDVPIGKGLSSSASLEISVLRALRSLLELPLTDLDLALLAHRAEVEFVGAPVGIMDQMVCSLGAEGVALFIDALTRETRAVRLPRDIAIGVIDSGIAHQHVSGDYRTRRYECEQAARLLGVKYLREVAPDDLPRVNQLPPPLDRRARHVVTEDARVLSAVDAIEREDMTTLGSLFFESHKSMRDDFEVSLPEIDHLVEIARAAPGVLGARLTGGGFGGAVVILCPQESVRQTTESIVARYRSDTNHDGRVLLPMSR
jgi:galactokinase